MKSHSQKERILALLKAAGVGVWVPLPAILDLRIAQYNARIRELKSHLLLLGLTIENRTEWRDGVQHSEFRLALISNFLQSSSSGLVAPHNAHPLAPKDETVQSPPTPETPTVMSVPRATSLPLRAPATVNSPDQSASDAAASDEDSQEGVRCPSESVAAPGNVGDGKTARAFVGCKETAGRPAVQLPLL